MTRDEFTERSLHPVVYDRIVARRSQQPFTEVDVASERATALAEARRTVSASSAYPAHDLRVPGAHGAPDVPVRMYTPDDAEHTLMHVHGGGFVFGSIDGSDSLARGLAEATRRTVVSVEYRLAPEAPYPAGLNDVETVYEWLERGESFAPGAVAVSGESAGACLTAALCLRRRDKRLSLPEAQLLYYPCFDPRLASDSWRLLGPHNPLSPADMAWLWHQYLGSSAGADPADPYAVPALADDLSQLPPTLMLTAELDALRDEAEEFASRLAAEGVIVMSKRYPSTIHGFLNLEEPHDRADALGLSAAFLLAAGSLYRSTRVRWSRVS